MTTLRLKKREERRVLAGHSWVFSNEIDTALTPLKGLEAGVQIKLESANGKFLAHGFANPNSLIAVRIISRRGHELFDDALIERRLEHALQLREKRYPDSHCYRLVYGESDGLPGLVVDRYGDVCVMQITAAGMERCRDSVVQQLLAISNCSAILLRNDNPIRELEGLSLYREWVHGSERETLQLTENGLQFEVPADVSQKTGWFYDHRESRLALQPWVRGARVLDVYSYLGGFGIHALHYGADSVLAIDASAAASQGAKHNAVTNGVGSKFTTETADAVEGMRALVAEREQFDVVILDPPAFIKKRKDRDAGTRHYALNNRLAMKLLAPNGLLLSASCSQALSHADLQQIIRQNAPGRQAGVQFLESLQQAPDHPVDSAMPETLYLSGVISRLR